MIGRANLLIFPVIINCSNHDNMYLEIYYIDITLVCYYNNIAYILGLCVIYFCMKCKINNGNVKYVLAGGNYHKKNNPEHKT